MKTLNDIFDEKITNILESISSIFSKDDVTNLLIDLRKQLINESEQTNPYPTADQLEELEKNIINALDNPCIDFIDYSSAEFGIDYCNKIEIENIDINTDSIASAIIEYITNK